MSIYWREYTQSREALTKKLLTCADFVVAEAGKVRNIHEGGGGGGAYLRGAIIIVWYYGLRESSYLRGKGLIWGIYSRKYKI